jgi:hypothetical protein
MTVSRKPFSTTTRFSFANETEVVLEPRAYLGLSKNCYFSYKSQRFRWSGCTKLKREDGRVIARFDRMFFVHRQDGRLEVYEQGREMIDVIIATLMMVLCRDEEKGF